MEETTRTLLFDDLFTQGGTAHEPLTEGDIHGPSKAFRRELDYFSQTKNAPTLIEGLAKANRD